MQVVAADRWGQGHFFEVLRRLSWPFPVLFMEDRPWPNNTCLRTMINNKHPGSSLFSYTGVGRRNDCKGPLFQAFTRWLRDLFPDVMSDSRKAAPCLNVTLPPGVRDPLAPRDQGRFIPKRPLVRNVVWMSRRDFEAMHLAEHPLSSWQSQRIIDNEPDLVAALHKAVLEWNARACFRQHSRKTIPAGETCRDSLLAFEFKDLEPFDAPLFPDQLSALGQASVLVGLHGAALANTYWMEPGKGAVIEILHNVPGQYHYDNMARWLGHTYQAVSCGGSSVKIEQAVAALKAAMDDVATRVK
uniref:Glycosyltransferase 61 catalytic domain-containing protein n=1 Tax=Chlamydomonas leiostraca TaxID=1034604 RepID=A0A7S0S5J2_9CHLO